MKTIRHPLKFFSFSDEEYLRYDPFDGDRDVDIRCRTRKLVKVRKPQKCHGLDAATHWHPINPGERALYEQAVVDGEWGRYYVCLGCMNKWLTDDCHMAPNARVIEESKR
jgi:hypothetical protein